MYGQELPSFVSDTGTYNLTNSNVFGIGSMISSRATINLTGAGVYGVAGPYTALGAFTTVNKTHAATQAFVSRPVLVQTIISNTGGGTMTATESAMNVALTLGTNVTASTVAAVTSVDPVVGSGSTITSNMGVSVAAKVVGTYNAGYQYGTTVPTAAGNYAFDSSTSDHASRFGGGMIRPVTIVTTVAPTLNASHYAVSLTGTASCVLPAVAAVSAGIQYKVLNISGANRTVTSASTISGVSAVIGANTSRTFINDGTKWLSFY